MMKKIILAALLILASFNIISLASAEKPQDLLFMTLNYNDNKVTIGDIAVGKGFYTPFAEDENIMLDECSLETIDKNANAFRTYFYVENKRFEDIISPDGEMTGRMHELNNVNFSVIIPYSDLDRIKITCPSNSIVLNRKDMDIKPLVIPAYNENTAEQKTGNEKADEAQKYISSQNSDKRSLFLKLIGVIENVFYYIFG